MKFHQTPAGGFRGGDFGADGAEDAILDLIDGIGLDFEFRRHLIDWNAVKDMAAENRLPRLTTTSA